MRQLRSHGVTRERDLMTQVSEGDWYYQQIDLGFNYRMTELQAALGVSQMRHLEAFVAKRHQLAQRYFSELADLPIVLPYQSKDSHSSLHLFPIQLAENHSRKWIFNQLREQGVGVNVHYIPVHTQPYYQNLGFKIGDYPNAEHYYQNAISIPLHQGLSDDEQSFVIKTLRSLLA